MLQKLAWVAAAGFAAMSHAQLSEVHASFEKVSTSFRLSTKSYTENRSRLKLFLLRCFLYARAESFIFKSSVRLMARDKLRIFFIFGRRMVGSAILWIP